MKYFLVSILVAGLLPLNDAASLEEMGGVCSPSMGAEASRRFAYELYATVVEQANEPGNVFLAPTTVASVLSMLIAGAANSTKEQLWSGLMFQNISDQLTEDDLPCLLRIYSDELVRERKNEKKKKKENDIVEFENPLALRTASKLFGAQAYDFSQSFIQKTAPYGAKLERVNFAGKPDQTRNYINKWVATMTEDRIQDLFSKDDISPDTILAIASAIYFKGLWRTPFDPKRTSPGTFDVNQNTIVDVDFMSVTSGFRTSYSDDLQAQLLELPYKKDAFGRYRVSMIVILPLRNIEILEQRLTEEYMSAAFNELFKEIEFKTVVKLPKFKMESEYKLQPILESMGMTDMFQRGLADFGPMRDEKVGDSRPLYVSSAVHKTFVEVDEAGTEAAGATGIGIVPLSLPPSFICDKPFLTVIYEKESKTVLFIGKVYNPSA